MNLKSVDKYLDKLKENGINQYENIERIIKEYKLHYPELAHYKRIPGKVRFTKGTHLVEEFFNATAYMWLQIYKELGLPSRYEIINGRRSVLLSSDDMLSLIYLEIPRIMLIINYDITKSPKQYFKSRLRMLVSENCCFNLKSLDNTDYEISMEDVDEHNDDIDAGI